MRQRLDKLDDRQCRQVLYFLYGVYKGSESAAARQFAGRLRDGIEWMERGRKGQEDDTRGIRTGA